MTVDASASIGAGQGQAALRRRRVLWVAGAVVLLPVLVVLGASFLYERPGGGACASCHEIWQPYTDWKTSTHRNVKCGECHGDVFTADAGFHINNMRRIVAHLRGKTPEQPRLKTNDVIAMVVRCEKCHREEFGAWRASGHSATYQEIFLNAEHNQREMLMDDCLRCHGMHFGGSMRDLVTPLDRKGPWRLQVVAMKSEPVIPCLSCHQIHQEGALLARRDAQHRKQSGAEEVFRPSLGLFDRRELRHVAAAALPLPRVFENEREIKISPDQRQALCYQCHAPEASKQVKSGDDRTPIGVHEGLSCLSCHLRHDEQTRASCATCHPRLSNCGIEVEKMDTTFKDRASKHNIHFAKCKDCHTKGVPAKKKGDQHVARLAGAQTAQVASTFSDPQSRRAPETVPRKTTAALEWKSW